eukprot:6196596-Pleurochrysis_carterae.AAC.1
MDLVCVSDEEELRCGSGYVKQTSAMVVPLQAQGCELQQMHCPESVRNERQVDASLRTTDGRNSYARFESMVLQSRALVQNIQTNRQAHVGQD